MSGNGSLTSSSSVGNGGGGGAVTASANVSPHTTDDDIPPKPLHHHSTAATNGAAFQPPANPEKELSNTKSRKSLFSKRPWKTKRRPFWICILLAGMVVVLALALGLGLGLGLRHHGHHGPVIDLGYARYRGSYLSSNISEYLGMRFAQPPTGNLRWRAPVSPKNQSDVQIAQRFQPICLGISQNASSAEDEDCLYVNVWAPTNATADDKLPVMVFIQGGGYTLNANANWNGSELVRTSGNNIVFVNFNYRVSLWGFLAGEEVRQDGDLNVGLLDQRFLLQWVQTHIATFGGDPNHVVIHGISAGAGSVATHLVAYSGRNDNLFVGAIAESTFFPAQQPVSALETQLNDTMNAAGCGSAADRMACLRGKSTKELQGKTNQPSPFPGEMGDPLFYWTPCIDGDLLRDYPYTLYERGEFIKVPILFGTCTNEGAGFAPNASTESEVELFFQNNFPNMTTTQANQIPNLYPLEPSLPEHADWFPSASRAYAETTFICPTNTILNAMLNATTNSANASNSTTSSPPSARNSSQSTTGVWSYRYNVHDNWNTARGLGVPHVYESTAVFGPGNLGMGPSNRAYYTYNAPIVPVVMNYWTSFVRTLDPNVHKDPSAPEWQQWSADQTRLVLQTNASMMERVDDGQTRRCQFWKDAAVSMEQ